MPVISLRWLKKNGTCIHSDLAPIEMNGGKVTVMLALGRNPDYINRVELTLSGPKEVKKRKKLSGRGG